MGIPSAVMAMAISELTGDFYGLKNILFWWGFLSTYNLYKAGISGLITGSSNRKNGNAPSCCLVGLTELGGCLKYPWHIGENEGF
jgi:hypothetical protein